MFVPATRVLTISQMLTALETLLKPIKFFLFVNLAQIMIFQERRIRICTSLSAIIKLPWMQEEIRETRVVWSLRKLQSEDHMLKIA